MLIIKMKDEKLEQQQQLTNSATKLYVSNIPVESDHRSLTAYFSRFGRVLQCSVVIRNTKYAFIHYATQAEVENVLRNANRMFLMGHKLTIKLSRTPTSTNYNPSNTDPKLYVSNLPDCLTENELKFLFEKYGDIEDCSLMPSTNSAFINFKNYKHANLALNHLDGFCMYRKYLTVKHAKYSKSSRKSTENNKLESSILCYRASDLETSTTTTIKQNVDWIQMIETGSLPVVADTNKLETDLNLPLSLIPTPQEPDFFSAKIPAIKQNIKMPVSPTINSTNIITTTMEDKKNFEEPLVLKRENDLLKNLIKQINEKTMLNEKKMSFTLFSVCSVTKQACYA